MVVQRLRPPMATASQTHVVFLFFCLLSLSATAHQLSSESIGFTVDAIKIDQVPAMGIAKGDFNDSLSRDSSRSIEEIESNIVVAKIGAIINTVDSRIGKEQKTAMEIAVQDFNRSSSSYKLLLQLRESGGDPIKAASAARDLVEEQQSLAIIGMLSWPEITLIVGTKNRTQVPILSSASSPATPWLTSTQWPFLVRMSKDLVQMRCIAAIVDRFRWRRVIAIYEDNAYAGDFGLITLLSGSLQDVGSEIEHQSAFPPLTSISDSDPRTKIREELLKLNSMQTRVFVVVQLSMPSATLLFSEAMQMGMLSKGYVWITTETVTSLLDSVNVSVISSMQGVIGVKSYFDEIRSPYRDFLMRFKPTFRSEYPEEDNPEPGIFALRSYDAVQAVARGMEKNFNVATESNTTESLLSSIWRTDFEGLSGRIRFEDGELAQLPAFQIVNVVGKSYRELGFWSLETGFSESISNEKGIDSDVFKDVFWPGSGSNTELRGWAPPSNATKLKIVVPRHNPFEQFVKVEYGDNGSVSITGFCIDLFQACVDSLPYYLPYELEPDNGSSFNDLVKQVYLKKYDAAVGDITILAERSLYVDYTQPYVETGLSMLVELKTEESKAWLFMRPFTMGLWLMSGLITLYTGLIVWFLEHRRNADFRGSWHSQLGTALWFSFSSLFFAHRENLRSNFTRVVIVVWLFVVLVLTSSYTASLTSMLTVKKLEAKVSDVATLKRDGSNIGCDGGSFIVDYLKTVLNFDENKIVIINAADDFPMALKNGTIAAAFLENAYLKHFFPKYCDGYTIARETFKFGGFGFIFQKGSLITADISDAILRLSQNGQIKALEDKWFPSSSSTCSTITTQPGEERMGLESFWELFIITGCTSTITFLLFMAQLFRRFLNKKPEAEERTPIPRDKRTMIDQFIRYFNKVDSNTNDIEEMRSLSMHAMHEGNTPEHPQNPDS